MTQKVSFKNKQGELLSARLELPLGQTPLSYALFAHCFTCNKNLSAIRNISRSLNQAGIAVLRFDFTGLGESEGEFAETNYSSNVDDLLSAASYLTEHYESPSLLVGHSLGGAAVISAAAKISSVQAVATIGAPASPAHVSHLFGGSIDVIKRQEIAEVNIGGRPFTIKKQFLDDISAQNLSDTLSNLKKPILILHSPQDRIVGIDNASTLYGAAFHPKSFVSLDGADHLLSDKQDSAYVGQMIASWAARYLDLKQASLLETSQQVVVRLGEQKYTTKIRSGQHTWLADEPVSLGGQNLGPGPYELLLSSLGACTAMTLRMYADRKKWDLKEISVHLSHGKIYAEDCVDCEKKSAKIDHISRSIEVEGALDDAQKKRLLEIADRCPVHRTISGEISFTTEIKQVNPTI